MPLKKKNYQKCSLVELLKLVLNSFNVSLIYNLDYLKDPGFFTNLLLKKNSLPYYKYVHF